MAFSSTPSSQSDTPSHTALTGTNTGSFPRDEASHRKVSGSPPAQYEAASSPRSTQSATPSHKTLGWKNASFSAQSEQFGFSSDPSPQSSCPLQKYLSGKQRWLAHIPSMGPH